MAEKKSGSKLCALCRGAGRLNDKACEACGGTGEIEVEKPRETEDLLWPKPSRIILCIGDNPSALTLRTMELQRSGYTALTASSGSEALRILKRTNVSLVLSDDYLRDDRGTEIAAKIKALKPEVPVLILSGLADRVEQTEYVDGFIDKTTGPTNLLVKIARALKL